MHWLTKVIFALVYTSGYFFLAVMSTGGGHGHFYLLIPALPWSFILAALCFIGKLDTQLNQILFVMVMSGHYVLLIVLLSGYSFEEDRGWTKWGVAFVPVAWYVAGQGFIWVSFVNELMRKRKE